jgi:RNA polymerase sigma-70 factor (ECF subfamily)
MTDDVLTANTILCGPHPETLHAGSAAMDERSFQALYDQTAWPLRSYVARVLGSATNANDIVQDAFLRLLRAPPATEDVQQLRALLFRIASNLMVDYWRQRQRERLAPEDRAIATTSDPDVALRVDMARTFGQLKPQQRQLLWMAYVEGANHREIAMALGLRERSVRVLLHRARQKLAQLLVRSGQGEREC